jgi:hypothetical protein
MSIAGEIARLILAAAIVSDMHPTLTCELMQEVFCFGNAPEHYLCFESSLWLIHQGDSETQRSAHLLLARSARLVASFQHA